MKTEQKSLVVIPAKGNSTRLYRKNLLPVWEKPMIYWSVSAALKSIYTDRVIINTNDPEIISTLCSLITDSRLLFMLRDNSLDEVPKQEIIRKTLVQLNDSQASVVVSLQPNSPQVISQMIDQMIDKLTLKKLNEVFSVSKDLLQNGAIRCMKREYANQRDLSTHCGVFVVDAIDVHTLDDIERVRSLECPHVVP